MTRPRLLFVEDDDTFRGVLTRELEGLGFVVTARADAEGALAFAAENTIDLALLDLRLGGSNGIDLLGSLKEIVSDVPVLFLTGQGSMSDAVEAMRAGAFDFLVKPTPLDELELVLARALEHGRLLRQNQRLKGLEGRDEPKHLFGESPSMRALRDSIPRIAQSDASVLIQGENGTGKELVARAIHQSSPRSEEAFVVVNCGAIPAELFESELFGHARGAFTGADRRRLGLLALAEEGTLFLDEIGELPMSLQPALLRALQFGEYRPVGQERNEQADVRFLAATNRDLEDAVEAGEFREDLYHRIATLVVSVPPLRERGRDVEQLAERFLTLYNEHVDAEHRKRMSPAALERLLTHPWSGNVRELENVVTRAVTLVEGPLIELQDVERHLRPARRAHARIDLGLPNLDLSTLERAAIVQALQKHGGHRARAAAELGLASKTLYNKIRNHGIAPNEWEA